MKLAKLDRQFEPKLVEPAKGRLVTVTKQDELQGTFHLNLVELTTQTQVKVKFGNVRIFASERNSIGKSKLYKNRVIFDVLKDPIIREYKGKTVFIFGLVDGALLYGEVYKYEDEDC